MDIVLVTNKSYNDSLDKMVQIQNTLEDWGNLIFTGLNESASVNRNYGIAKVVSDIFIMIDDDVEWFYSGWTDDLVKYMMHDENIIITSARLINTNGSPGSMMGDNRRYDKGQYEAGKSGYKGYRRLPTACLAIRRNDILFDEGFIGSGYEDTDWFNRINEKYPDKKIMINNDCKLVHHNEQKNQGGKYFIYNKSHYLSLYPDDRSVINQKDWTCKNEQQNI